MGRMRWLAPLNTEMEEGDLRSIVEAGERIIRRVGMRVDGTEEFNGYLRDFGCEIDGAWVRFPEAVISKTMSRIADRKRNSPPERPQDHARQRPRQGPASDPGSPEPLPALRGPAPGASESPRHRGPRDGRVRA